MKTFIQIRQELNESPYGDPYRTVQRTKDAMGGHHDAIKKHDTAMQSHLNKANAAEKKGLGKKAEKHRESANAHHFGKEDHHYAVKLLKKHGPDHHGYESAAKDAHSGSDDIHKDH
jgi:hypothetical protein